MKKLLLLIFCILVTPVLSLSQTRVLFGPSASQSFDNTSAGVSGTVEIPFLKHFELDLNDTFSPYEAHRALGQGSANIGGVSGFIWLTKSFGIESKGQYSIYSTEIKKGAYYAYPGIAYRTYFLQFPTRFTFNYVQQFNNGVHNGIETSHLRGIDITTSARLGCSGSVCFRLDEQFQFGKVLTQGNPVCDGTLGDGSQAGLSPCPRGSALGGGVVVGFYIEFPRRRGRENDLF